MTTATLTRPFRNSVAASVLLTLDEARRSIVHSAVVCLQGAECGPQGLLAMLRGLPNGEGWSSNDEVLALEHRRVLDTVGAAGHGWVVDEQLDGIISATGLDEDVLRNVDVVASQLPEMGDYDFGATD